VPVGGSARDCMEAQGSHGLISIVLVRPPDITVDGQAKLMAVRTARGGMAVS
jgi:hypothetical protein